MTQNGLIEIDNLLHKKIEALIQHLHKLFKHSLPLFSVFTVFDPVLMASPGCLVRLREGWKLEDLCCRKSLRGSCRVSALQIFISRPQEADRGNSNCSCLKATSPEGLFLPPSCFICQSNLKVILSLPTTNTWPECGARSNLLIRSWEAFSTFLSVAQKCVQRSVISSLGKPLMYGSTRRREY